MFSILAPPLPPDPDSILPLSIPATCLFVWIYADPLRDPGDGSIRPTVGGFG